MTALRPILLIAVIGAGFHAVSAEETANPASPDARRPFVIGAEDVLEIVTWDEPGLSKTVKVRPDGRITLPLVRDVEVAGLTPEEVRVRITEKMRDYVRDPDVTVIVQEIHHFRVYFLGEIATQGPIEFQGPTRLLQAIAVAGGLTEFSNKKITIVREDYGTEKRIEVDYKKLWAGDKDQQNVHLKPGDTVLVK